MLLYSHTQVKGKMDIKLYALFVKKLNEVCGLEDDNLVYALLPSIDNKPGYMNGIYSHTLDKLPLVIDSSLEIFGTKKTGVAKSSYPYQRLIEEKNDLFNALSNLKEILKLKEIKINEDKKAAAFAALSSIYLESFIRPVQFFLPHSSIPAGHWEFWDKTNYLEFIKKIHQKETINILTKKLTKSSVWETKFRPDDFPEIVKRRLLKEKLLGKKLDPSAMIKAMIIRMGELAKPSINYEIIDFSIRSFFTYLGVKKYLRVDREIFFLRALEEEIQKILVDICK